MSNAPTARRNGFGRQSTSAKEISQYQTHYRWSGCNGIHMKPVGTYILLMALACDREIRVGALGVVAFRAGHYAYVGSAMGGLHARLARHLRQTKRMHWHIDYLLAEAPVCEVWYRVSRERRECAWATAMGAYGGAAPHIAPFGASDCRCHSHLFWCGKPFDLDTFRQLVPDGDALQRIAIPDPARVTEALAGLVAPLEGPARP